MKTRRVIIAIVFGLNALHTSGAVFTDWTSLDLTNYVAYGTLDGVPVSFAGNSDLGFSVTNGSAAFFDCGNYSPPLTNSDAIYLSGNPTARNYSFVFGGLVINPIIHLQSFASQLTFSTNVTRLSGSTFFSVSGSNVMASGAIDPSACSGNDTGGSIQIPGVFCSLSFTLQYTNGSIDGIWLQLGGTAARRQLTVKRATNSVELYFPTDPGISYQIQYSPILPATNWISLGSPIAGNGTTNAVSDSTGSAVARFYRLRIFGCQ